MKRHKTFLLVALLAVQTASASTLTVTTTADSGPGSLRAALASAAEGDTIDFAVTGTILLTSGELLVNKSVTISGPGSANLALDGNHTSRVFHVGSNTVVTIAGLTITNGFAYGPSLPLQSEGGGIFNDRATLTVSACTLSGNASYAGGGAILNYAQKGKAELWVVNSIVSGNSANGGGGAISSIGFFGTTAAVQIVNSTLSGNSASSGRGGAIDNIGAPGGNATMSIVNSTVSGNSIDFGPGGGISNFGSGSGGAATLVVSNTTVSGNSTPYYGGSGIFDHGGGFGGRASTRVVNSTVAGNSTDYGYGGGIRNYVDHGTATVEVVNCTLSGNSAGSGGGIADEVHNDGSAGVQIRNSTFSGNSATANGDNVFNLGFFSTASVEIGSTILNAGASGSNIFSQSGGTVTSLGYNLCSDDGSGFLTATSDQVSTDPVLGPLQDNGGPTFTHALLGCSPAIDQGKNFSASATDQRGLPRVFDYPGIESPAGGDGTDIGAFEAQTVLFDTTPPAITCLDDQVLNATSPAGVVVSFAPTASDNCSLASVTCTPPSGSTFAAGTTTVNCQAIDGVGLMSSCAFTIHVKGAAEQINDLIAIVQALPIDNGVKNGLLVKLQDALNGVNAGKKSKTCGALQDFINLCNAQAAKRNLDADTANYLIGEATRIRGVIGC